MVKKLATLSGCYTYNYEMDSSNSSKQNNNPSPNDDPADEGNEFCPGFKDVDAFVKYGLGTVVAATKSSASLPQVGDEYDFYRSFPGFQEFCETQGDTMLHCMSQIMKYHGCRAQMRDRNKLTGLEERYDLVVDANDVILEKVGILLDDTAGVNRSQQPVMPAGFQPPKIVVSSWNRKGGDSGSSSETFRLLHAKNITRPQLKFREKVDNSNTPFVPKIFIKPNAMKSLPSYFTNKQIRKERPEDLDVPAALADFIHQQRTQEHVEDMFAHPYQYELDHLVFSENQLSKPEPQVSTKCSFIDNVEDLVAVNEKLTKTTEFAVDLEHHSYRSFLGITCLMQISTREEDFIIDTLDLRSEMYILNEAFTDPNIVKVFHGADSDIEWLQKDLGLYIVNMFDTHQASRVLNLGRHSLDHLLKQFCNVDSDKRYQLADWRIRPLPEEMLHYARADTHYLLYVYDRLRVDLWEMGNGQPALLQTVWQKSKDISLKKYMKPLFTENSYMDLLRKQKKAFNTQQLAAFRLLYGWRDKLARQEDESTGYVLPNHMMIKISEVLPKEPQGIIACCNPVPPLVRQQVNELHLLVQQAREMPLLKVRDIIQRNSGLQMGSVSLFLSFVNHICPASVLSCDIFEQISNRWKLQSIEQQHKELEAKKKEKEDAKAAAASVTKKRERVASGTGESNPKPNKKLMKAADKQEECIPPAVFKPFDYSQSDFKVFAGTQPHALVHNLFKNAKGPKSNAYSYHNKSKILS
uniref:Exosome complex component 10 n=1 Tax=Esox lucius TaxID=8010 RepID=A0A6Q2X936_ESOLU